MFAILSVSSESRYKPSSILAFNVGKTNDELMKKNVRNFSPFPQKNGGRGKKNILHTYPMSMS